MTLRRGFRAEAERIASSVRAELALQPYSALSLNDLADKKNMRIVSAGDLVDVGRLDELERIQKFSFSACTFDIDGRPVIVFNPLRSEARRQSDIGHEISHVLLKHDLSEMREVAGLPFRTCRSDQEEEATNLGGTLLLPRALLVRALSSGMTPEDIARKYEVSVEMARFRTNTSGAAQVVKRAKAKRSG